jgi:cytoskeletal protein CcmA (bactofilin family)
MRVHTRLVKALQKDQRGTALVSALLLMIIMSGLAAALTLSGRIEVAIGDNEEVYAGARQAAETGLNSAAAAILALTANPTYDINNLIKGPDGLSDPANLGAAVNADNGSMSILVGQNMFADPTAPWPVTGTDFTFSVSLFDDDDPALYGAPLSAAALINMGPPPAPPEDGNGANDVNKRIVIRSIGFGPQGVTAQLDQMLNPITLPAVLVDGDLTMSGSVTVNGSQGSVHANGDLEINDPAVTISQNATATGEFDAHPAFEPGGMEGGDMPEIPLPDIHAIDYWSDADYILTHDPSPHLGVAGRIVRRVDNTVMCTVTAADANACRKVANPDTGVIWGWSWTPALGWDLTSNTASSATFYVEGDVKITGDPGSPVAPVYLSIIAEGDIEVSGNPDLRPEPASAILFVTDMDLKLHGNIAVPLTVEGKILVREQIDFAGNPQISGQVICQNVPSVSTLVTNNTIAGSVSITYNGLVTTVAYSVAGWREAQ